MDTYDQLTDLIKRYGELCFQMGSVNNYLHTSASVPEAILIRQQSLGVQQVTDLLRMAINSYGAKDFDHEMTKLRTDDDD